MLRLDMLAVLHNCRFCEFTMRHAPTCFCVACCQVHGDVQPADGQPRGAAGRHHLGGAHRSEEARLPLRERRRLANLQVSH